MATGDIDGAIRTLLRTSTPTMTWLLDFSASASQAQLSMACQRATVRQDIGASYQAIVLVLWKRQGLDDGTPAMGAR